MIFKAVLLIVYILLLLFIFLYSLSQFHLLITYLKSRKKESKYPFNSKFKPSVTIQLPVYNEKYVVERLLHACIQINYPKHLLQIQVLDDSTDETTEIIAQWVEHHKMLGFNINHIQRQNRVGFKAGALAEATDCAEGDFIAIFDADFVPHPEFINETIGYFSHPKVGMVQTPWHHLNAGYSMLTQLQAFALNAHFSVEQLGRNHGNHFINFNGTGGIWRKETIIDAGGWSSDTLTEDLDLSYRAQLKNWQFVYHNNIGSPAELPANIKALKTQQFRWTKGAAECARKNWLKVIQSSQKFSTKFHATFHLFNSFIFVCVALTAILSIPVMLVKPTLPELKWLFYLGSLFIFSLAVLGVYYFQSAKANKQHYPNYYQKFLLYFPLFLSFSMGLSLHNTIAVAEGYAGKKSAFLRTPKFNIVQKNGSWIGKSYLSKSFHPLFILEGILSVYFLWGVVLAFQLNDFGLFPLHLMLFFGFGAIFVYSVAHELK